MQNFCNFQAITEKFTIDGFNIDFANFRQGCLVIKKREMSPMKDHVKFALFEFSKGTDHSVQVALNAFRWLIAPLDVQLFFRLIFNLIKSRLDKIRIRLGLGWIFLSKFYIH